VEVVGVDRRQAGGLQHLGVLEAGAGQQLGRELGRAPHVAGPLGMGRDRRDAQPVAQRGDDARALTLDPVAQQEIHPA
jgi:hypothetical protein